MNQWILFGLIVEIILSLIVLFFVVALGKKVIYEKGILHDQIRGVENRLDQIRNIVDVWMNDIASAIDENNEKIWENNELTRRDIFGSINELKINSDANFVKSEKEISKECQELKKALTKVERSNESVQLNMSTIEEIFRLQLVNGLLNDAEKVVTDYKKTGKGFIE